MIEDDIIVLLLCTMATFVIGFCIGHTVLHKDAWLTIDKITQWIDDTNSNKWVSYTIHEQLEEKYEALLCEYEQYRGAIKAIDDCYKKNNKGDSDDR